MEKLKKIGIDLGYVLLCAAIVVAVVYAHRGAREHRTTQLVTGLDIHINGGNDHMLVDAESMYRWIAQHGVEPNQMCIDDVDLAALEEAALKHSAIESANAYISYDGRIDLTLIQRQPIARLRVDGGYDHYIANDGFLFRATDGYAAYVPVITGDYKPIVDSRFSGDLHLFIEDSIVSLKRRIDHLEHDKYQIYNQRTSIEKRNKAVQDSTVREPFWMSEEKINKRKDALKLVQRDHEQKYQKMDAAFVKRIDRLTREQERLQGIIAFLEMTDADHRQLMAFITYAMSDKFWSSEITQIVLTTDDKQMMSLQLVPRSGDFAIDIGSTDNYKVKLSNARRFYDKVLRNVGWDKFSRISVRYDGQVVCHPRKEKNGE